MKTLLLNALIIFVTFSYAQDFGKINDLDARLFRIINKNDTIEFIKTDSKIDTAKPVIIFLQGSMPKPLVIKWKDGGQSIISLNFDYEKIIKKYNLVLISMPNTPIIGEEKHLNSQYCYVTDTNNQNSFSHKYLENNYLEKYVERADFVVNYLISQKWVNKKQIIAIGHSQGCHIAVELALKNKNITSLGLLSFNPLGRIDQQIREIRKSAIKGLISKDSAQREINRVYEHWKYICDNPNSLEIDGDPIKTTYSFSKPQNLDLLKINIPIFIGYGTEDICSEYCDLLPLEFIRNKKENYKLKAYIDMEHNFAEVDKDGHPDWNKMHWDDVIKDMLEYFKQ